MTLIMKTKDGRRIRWHHLPALWERHLEGMLKDWQGAWMRHVEKLPDPVHFLDSDAHPSLRHGMRHLGLDYLLDVTFGDRALCRIAGVQWNTLLASHAELQALRSADPTRYVAVHGWSPLCRNAPFMDAVNLDNGHVLIVSALRFYPMAAWSPPVLSDMAMLAKHAAGLRRPHDAGHPFVVALAGWAARRWQRYAAGQQVIEFMRAVCAQNVPIGSLEHGLPQAAEVLHLLLETGSDVEPSAKYDAYRAQCDMSRPPPFELSALRRVIPDCVSEVVEVGTTARMMATAFVAQQRHEGDAFTADQRTADQRTADVYRVVEPREDASP